MDFMTIKLRAKKNLLEYVLQNLEPNFLEVFKDNPHAALEELSTLNTLITGCNLIGGQGLEPTPKPEDLKELTKNYFLYAGDNQRQRGLWVMTPNAGLTNDMKPCDLWMQYKLDSQATLKIAKPFVDIAQESFTPEFLEKNGQLVQDTKRPISTLAVNYRGEEFHLFVKGTRFGRQIYTRRPSHRLTGLAGISLNSSLLEGERFIELQQAGLYVPDVVATYDEDFLKNLYVTRVDGDIPSSQIPSMRRKIIEEDARMLSILCRHGYRKQGFGDFDDKVLSDGKLFLIDAEDLVDIYAYMNIDFRKPLLDPRDSSGIHSFRSIQKRLFKNALKDALFSLYTSTPLFTRDNE